MKNIIILAVLATLTYSATQKPTEADAGSGDETWRYMEVINSQVLTKVKRESDLTENSLTRKDRAQFHPQACRSVEKR